MLRDLGLAFLGTLPPLNKNMESGKGPLRKLLSFQNGSIKCSMLIWGEKPSTTAPSPSNSAEYSSGMC